MHAVVAAYLETQDAELARIYARAHELAEWLAVHRPASSSEALAARRDAERERRVATNRLGAIEEPLYYAVASAAATASGASPEPDPTLVDIVRQVRRRTRHGTQPCMLPMAQLDLRELVHSIEREQPLVMVVDPDRWQAAWVAHDVELATLHERRVDHEIRANIEDAEFRLQAGDDMQALIEFRTAGLNRRLTVERAILAANERWAATVADMLDEESARRFRAAVKAALYPALYPSRVDIAAVRERIAALESSDQPEVRGGASRNADAVRDLRAVVDAEMEALRERERLLESKIMELAVRESRAMTSRRARSELETLIEALYAERRESGRRVLEFCAALPELNDDPAVARLHAACADEPESGDDQGGIDPTGRGITNRPSVQGTMDGGPPQGGDGSETGRK